MARPSVAKGLLVSVLWIISLDATASIYDMYRSDYVKGAFCVAVAGACSADKNLENSFYQNPASLESGEPDLVYDADYNPSNNLEPGMNVGDKINSAFYTAGIARAGDVWGFGFAFSALTASVDAQASLSDSFTGEARTVATNNSSTTFLFNIPISMRLSSKWSLGLSLNGMYYQESFKVTGSPKSSTASVDRLPQIGVTLGGVYIPNEIIRYGSWLRTPITYYVQQNIVTQVASTQTAVVELVGLSYPILFSNGISITPFHDLKTILFDLDLIGTTANGQERTLDRFATVENSSAFLRAKGRSIAIEPHLAWRAPWWEGSKGTYTLGSYYENGRWDQISGRLHAVTSLAYDLKFAELIVALDVARSYTNIQFSFR